MDELTLDGKTYLSSKRAAQVTGYAKDYVGQLCREGRIEARLVGRNWYVLESSILEHRFGADEQPKESVQAPEPVASAWESPTYSAEPPQMVPELRPKPLEVPENLAPKAPALADMQSAWKEWFATQATEEKMLPDASDMLLEAAPEEVLLEEETAPELVREAEEVSIHIERHQEAPVEEIEPVEEVYEEPVALHRSYVQPKVEEAVYRRGVPRRQSKGMGYAASRALFLGVAGIAVTVAIIGSGAADRYLEPTFNSPLSPITSFIGGVNKVTK